MIEQKKYSIPPELKKEVLSFLQKKPYKESYPSWVILTKKDILSETELSFILDYLSDYPLYQVLKLIHNIRTEVKVIEETKEQKKQKKEQKNLWNFVVEEYKEKSKRKPKDLGIKKSKTTSLSKINKENKNNEE